MNKNDFWIITLAVFLIIAIATGWSFWVCVVLILNGLLVLYNVVSTFYKSYRKRGK